MDLLTGFVDCSKQIGVTSPDYRVFKAKHKSDISLPFFLRIFQTCYKLRIFYHLGQGVAGMGRWRLPAEQLKLFLLPIPPLAEQQAIADYLDEKCADIDSLIQTKQSKIDSLKEYKKSIIYEYVTGKREVNE
jgi:type I restriction enzyme S subunit